MGSFRVNFEIKLVGREIAMYVYLEDRDRGNNMPVKRKGI